MLPHLATATKKISNKNLKSSSQSLLKKSLKNRELKKRIWRLMRITKLMPRWTSKPKLKSFKRKRWPRIRKRP